MAKPHSSFKPPFDCNMIKKIFINDIKKQQFEFKRKNEFESIFESVFALKLNSSFFIGWVSATGNIYLEILKV